MAIHAIVMAAGQGTRMNSDLAKVLHPAAGRTLLDWSLSALQGLDLDSIAVVVGHQATAVTASIADHELAPQVATALQAEQHGTGHAAGIGVHHKDQDSLCPLLEKLQNLDDRLDPI